MMDGRFGGHTGMMHFGRDLRLRIRYREDDLNDQAISERDLMLHSWDDADQRWVAVVSASIDSETNTIEAQGPELGNYYSLVAIGTTTGASPGTGVPSTDALLQNYPNPFNPSTRISYSLPTEQHVRLVLYDLSGREVMLLEDAVRRAGSHDVALNASGLPSGAYIYRLVTDRFTDARKLILVR
jgi:hypothetical protein